MKQLVPQSIIDRYCKDHLGILRDVLLSAGESGNWHTIRELADLTGVSKKVVLDRLGKSKDRFPDMVLLFRTRRKLDTSTGMLHRKTQEYQMVRL